jgi:Subtilase family
MSLGIPESTYHGSVPLTTPPGHTGITFVAASGDNGLTGGSDWPAVSPTVLSVGATTLDVSFSGQYLGEVAWSDSGGGPSHLVLEPGYQRSLQSSGKRVTPDVVFDGDPNTGVEVYQTTPETGLGSWQIVGGTSLGTPAWAAIIAIADQGRALEGKGSLNGATQTLPTLYSLPTSAFHAVGSDRSGQAASMGLGSPNGPILIADLVASNISVPLTTSGLDAAAFKAAQIRRARRAVVEHARKHSTSKEVTRAATRRRHVPAAAPHLAHPTIRNARERHR